MQVGYCTVRERCDGRDFWDRSSELPSGGGPPGVFREGCHTSQLFERKPCENSACLPGCSCCTPRHRYPLEPTKAALGSPCSWSCSHPRGARIVRRPTGCSESWIKINLYLERS